MKEYYSNIYRWIIPLTVLTVTLGPLAYFGIKNGFLSGNSIIIIVSFAVAASLLGVYYFVYFSMKHPVVVISDSEIIVRSYFLEVSTVDNLQQYHLVVSNDFLAFRKQGEQDIMVDRANFSNNKWKNFVKDLKSLKFAGVIE